VLCPRCSLLAFPHPISPNFIQSAKQSNTPHIYLRISVTKDYSSCFTVCHSARWRSCLLLVRKRTKRVNIAKVPQHRDSPSRNCARNIRKPGIVPRDCALKAIHCGQTGQGLTNWHDHARIVVSGGHGSLGAKGGDDADCDALVCYAAAGIP